MTLEQAQQPLSAWLDADLALATGKSYKIGSRDLTRADANEIKDRIAYWSQQVALLSTTGKRGGRVLRIVPRDI